jgi:hypothetical protein
MMTGIAALAAIAAAPGVAVNAALGCRWFR